MNRVTRTTIALAAAAALAPALSAQIPGMPLFTNPRYSTGLRVHADFGRPTGSAVVAGTDQTVIQGGAGFVLGPIGIDLNVGTLRNDLKNAQQCQANPTSCDTKAAVSASGLAQLKIMGGGASPVRLSLFGGASYTIKAAEAAGLTPAQQAALGLDTTKILTIPVGAALGYHISLGVASINLWGAPRIVMFKPLNCGTACPSSSNQFRWAIGADVPIFKILSVRAAYDSGKTSGVTTSFWGVGASIGFGGMR